MIGYAAAFGAGLLFGIGLWISGMATPRKVLDFLDVTGSWDPSLALVMAGAVGVTLSAFGPIFKRRTPLYAGDFVVPLKKQIDAPLVIGAALFGIGWGIGGYCPGPALTALSNLSAEAF
ncbi:MAG: YeeE/YedE family protein, partial [Betaproteobacteria bacterium]